MENGIGKHHFPVARELRAAGVVLFVFVGRHAVRPLGPLFDEELSDDEARQLFRVRKSEGTADEAIFMAQREVIFHLGKQNGHMAQIQESLIKHLDGHPPTEKLALHMADSHDAAVTARFIRRAGGWGTAGLAVLVSVFGAVLTVLQIIQLTR